MTRKHRVLSLLLAGLAGTATAQTFTGTNANTNAEEVSGGTPQTTLDVDGDGVLDADEVNVYGSDPARADTDGDGMNDGDEIVAGTELTNSASYLYLILQPFSNGVASLSWPSVAGERTYELYVCTNLAEGNWERIYASGPTPPFNSVDVYSTGDGADQLYFTLGVVDEPFVGELEETYPLTD